MAKKEFQNTEKVVREVILNDKQLDQLQKAIQEAGSETNWYIKKGSLTKLRNGTLAVVQTEDGDIPFNRHKRYVEQLNNRTERRKFASDKKIYDETGQWPFSPLALEIKAKMRQSFGS